MGGGAMRRQAKAHRKLERRCLLHDFEDLGELADIVERKAPAAWLAKASAISCRDFTGLW